MTAAATETTSTCPVLLTYREAAAQLHVSEVTAQRLAAAGRLAKVRVSRNAVRIRQDSVISLIERGRDRQDSSPEGVRSEQPGHPLRPGRAAVTAAMTPAAWELDALRDAMALIRAYLRGDAEGFGVLLNATTEPRACSGMLAAVAGELLRTVKFEDTTPDQVLSDLVRRLEDAVLDTAPAFPAGGR